ALERSGTWPVRTAAVVLDVAGVADGPYTMAGARAEVPELLARVGVVRVHGALEVSVDHEAAARREHAPDRRILEVDAPLALAGDGITRVEVTVGLAPGRVLGDLVTAEEESGRRLGLRRLLFDRDLLADLHRRVVPELGLRVVRARVPAAAAGDPRANELRLAHLARRVAADELAGLGVDRLHEVVGVDHRPHVVALAVGAVVPEHEAGLVPVDATLL